jgi:hypothetical protein
VLVDCLEEGFDEVLAFGGSHGAVGRPLATGTFPGEPLAAG